MTELVALDWLVIALYFGALAALVWWCSGRQNTTTDYFLAGRNAGFFVIGGSLFASNIGSEHIVGLAGQGATTGMAMAHYELHAWIMVLLAWVFVPFYYRAAVFTVPEFLERRFDARVRLVLSVVSLLAYVLTKVSVTVYAGAKVFQVLLPGTFGSPEGAFWTGAVVTVVLTGVYTVFGGLRAVLYTDTAQSIILLLGSLLLTAIGLDRLGGWGTLQAIAAQQGERFALWRPATDAEFPWLGILIGSPIVGIWYWCTDQYIVQRTLSARDLRQARRGALFGGLLKVTPVLLFIVPGLVGYALAAQGQLQMPLRERAGQWVLDGDRVYATLVTALLPAGLRGLVVAGLLAALMSSLSSLFNSSASLFTVDIYARLRPGMPERHLVRVGRVATTAVVGLGLIWIPLMSAISELGLYHYLQSVQGYLAPPITTVFLLGLFWRRMNARGALWGMGCGFALGLAKLAIQSQFGAGKLPSPGWLAAVGDFNFLYFSSLLFAASVTISVVAALCGPAPPAAKLRGLTYATVTADERAAIRTSWDRWDVALTGLVLSLVVALYVYFSFWLD